MKLLELLRELRGLNRKQLTLVYRTAKQIDISRQGFARYDGDATPEDVKAVKAEFDAILAEFQAVEPKEQAQAVEPEKAKRGRKAKSEATDLEPETDLEDAE